MALFNLVSAIVLILIGMRYIRKALDRLFGNQLVDWLQNTAKNRYKAFLAGIVAGLISPSSSAIAMLSVQIVNQTALTAGRMLAVVLGANIGLTVVVHLVTLDLQEFAGLLIAVGGLAFLFLKRTLFRGIGQFLLGLGVILLAMGIIGNVGKLGAGNPDIRILFSVLDHYSWLVFVATALLALLLQSSTASIGLGIGLAKAGLVSAVTLVPWILGANLGIGLTMLIAGWTSVEGRRLGLASIILKGFFALLILIGGSDLALYLIHILPGGIDRGAANLNTLFNVVIGLSALPILSLISRCLTYLVPSEEPEDQDQASVFLDPLLLQTPSLALSQAAREELRILDLLKLMLRAVWKARSSHDRRLRIASLQDRIIAIHDALKNYLGQFGDESLSKSDIDWRFNLLDYAQELRIVGTLIRRDLSDSWAQTARSAKAISPQDMEELESILSRTLERMQKATVLLMTRDALLAHQFIREKDD
ncbi:MAG: Na/Pi cotransporter family protein, partial [Verrucomicrobia bacterium]|nr:Na/Pi cotransporter family protein [Verrucomicrobiota bacterium]